MKWEAWLTLAVVATAMWVMARERIPPAVAVLGGTVVLLVGGVIDASEAFAGFSNEAVITVGALYVVARSVEVTGALAPMVTRLMGKTEAHREGGVRQLARIVVPTAAASAFLNNTPIVAMIAPQVAEWASRRGIAASKFLMPVSYAAILGGCVTLIGTSTNIVVSGLLVDAGHQPLGLFELTPVGLPIAFAGCTVVVLLAGRLLPIRAAPRDHYSDSARSFTVAMRVVPGSPLDGRSISEGELRHLRGVYCVEIDRDGQRIAPVAPTEVLQGGDVLAFVGNVQDVVDLQTHPGLASAEEQHFKELRGEGLSFFEAVVGAESPLVGMTLREVNFRGRYQAAVLAIHRAGESVEAKLGAIPLRTGDTLLLLADNDFRRRWREQRDFVLIAKLGGTPIRRTRKAPLVGFITGLLVIAAGSGMLPILQASLAAVLLLLAARVLTVAEARGAVDVDVLVIIAAAFGLGNAIAASGLADTVAALLVDVFSPLGAVGALAGVLLATMMLTEAISNNAAAVLMLPIALSAAAALGADPRPFAIAVSLGASLSFLTPIGYQTNLMVYGMAGYRYSDYAKLGLPLNLVVVTLSIILIPRIWSL